MTDSLDPTDPYDDAPIEKVTPADLPPLPEIWTLSEEYRESIKTLVRIAQVLRTIVGSIDARDVVPQFHEATLWADAVIAMWKAHLGIEGGDLPPPEDPPEATLADLLLRQAWKSGGDGPKQA